MYKANNKQCRSILITAKKYITNNGSNTKWTIPTYIYALNASDDLWGDEIDEIDHKYPVTKYTHTQFYIW